MTNRFFALLLAIVFVVTASSSLVAATDPEPDSGDSETERAEPETPRSLFDRGREAAADDRLQEASRLFERADRQGLEDFDLFNEWAWTRYRLDEPIEAHDLALKAVDHVDFDDDLETLHDRLGRAYYNAGRAMVAIADDPELTERARQAYQRVDEAWSIDYGAPDDLHTLAFSYYSRSLDFRDHDTVRHHRDRLAERQEIEADPLSEPHFLPGFSTQLENTCSRLHEPVEPEQFESVDALCDYHVDEYTDQATETLPERPSVLRECNKTWSSAETDPRYHLVEATARMPPGSIQGGATRLFFVRQTDAAVRAHQLGPEIQLMGASPVYTESGSAEDARTRETDAGTLVVAEVSYRRLPARRGSPPGQFERRERLYCLDDTDSTRCHRLVERIELSQSTHNFSPVEFDESDGTPELTAHPTHYERLTAEWEFDEQTGRVQLSEAAGRIPDCMKPVDETSVELADHPSPDDSERDK